MQRLINFANKLAFLLLVAGVTVPVIPQAAADDPVPVSGNEPVVALTSQWTHLELVERSAKIIELKSKITRVDGFDESVVQVRALTPNRIHLWANVQGVTTVNLTDESGTTHSVEVFVKGDVRYLQALISSNFPDATVEVLKIQDSSVVLRGWVTQPEQINYIVDIAEQFFPQVLNQIKVGGVQQVKLKVRVMEVQRSKIRQLGFNFLYLNRDGYLASTPGQLTQVAGTNLPFKPGTPSVLFDQKTLAEAAVSFGLTGTNSIFNGFLQALKEEGLLKILAEPNVVTTNGRPATLLSGGEFPVLVPQSLGTVTIEWREFGTRLEAVPIILGNGRLRLEIQPEVSERDFANAVSVNGLTVPGLTTRRVNTQVEMKFGQTLMVGGLIANRRTAETDKIPVLGDLPWVGVAFRKMRYDDVETELVIMVTPELVAPLDADQVPPGGPGLGTETPTDKELYIDGLLEVPNYGGCQDAVGAWEDEMPLGRDCQQCPSDSCVTFPAASPNVTPSATGPAASGNLKSERDFPPLPPVIDGASDVPPAPEVTRKQETVPLNTSDVQKTLQPTDFREASPDGHAPYLPSTQRLDEKASRVTQTGHSLRLSSRKKRPGLIAPKPKGSRNVPEHRPSRFGLVTPTEN